MTIDQPSPVAPGDILDGKYRVDRVLGIGGMGIVVAATHVQLEDKVALKFLLPAAVARPEIVARFAREARAAVKIKSEHVARVLDVGTLPTGAPFMVMEYLDGEDLEQVLARTGPLSVEDAVDYVLQASEAIAEAHGYGIVHRDLKPANLFLTRRPNGRSVVKVLDFGISKSSSGASEAALTKTSAIMGSPLYMSPEQMTAAKNVDARSDIWALGVILYELLTQRHAFLADTMPELVAAILQGAPEPLRTVRGDVPEGLAVSVMRCLEKDPARRFANVAELAVALAAHSREGSGELVTRISHSLGVAVPSAAPAPRPSAPTLAVAQSSSPTGAPWSQTSSRTRSPSKAWFAIPVVVLLVASGAFFVSRTRPAASASTDIAPTALAQVPSAQPSPPPAAPLSAPVESAAVVATIPTPASASSAQSAASPKPHPTQPTPKPRPPPEPTQASAPPSNGGIRMDMQ